MKIIRVVASIISDDMKNSTKIFATARRDGELRD